MRNLTSGQAAAADIAQRIEAVIDAQWQAGYREAMRKVATWLDSRTSRRQVLEWAMAEAGLADPALPTTTP